MANKAIVYAIYPNQIQDNQCQNTFGSCRFIYNKMLSIQQERHKKGEKHLSKISANNYCNQELKKEDKWNRLESLASGKKQMVNDESIKDTLLDLANYAIMTYMELEKREIDTPTVSSYDLEH